jgi:hypothetical protein
MGNKIEKLPYSDEHRQAVHASADVLWNALLRVLHHDTSGSDLFFRVLGCDPVQGTAEFIGRPGDTVPGFRVDEAEPGRRLKLGGHHRFSDYALTFVFDGEYLCAQSRAAFPGVLGWLYRTAVIGSGCHQFIIKRLLRRVVRSTQA